MPETVRRAQVASVRAHRPLRQPSGHVLRRPRRRRQRRPDRGPPLRPDLVHRRPLRPGRHPPGLADPAEQGRRRRQELRRAREGDEHRRRAQGATAVPQALDLGDRTRRRHPDPAGQHQRAPRGRARRRHRRPRRAERAPRPGRRLDLRLHDRQRRHRAGHAEERRAVDPRQGLRLLLPARPVDRDRPGRPGQGPGRPRGHLHRRRQPAAEGPHQPAAVRRPDADLLHLRRHDAAARRRRPDRDPVRRRADLPRRPGRRDDRGAGHAVQPGRRRRPRLHRRQPPLTTHPTTPTVSVTRFCPSPTGLVHVGAMRTALFNWAHARHTGGTFVFRIEDTDAARDTEESYRHLLDCMRWLGLDWDEGPEVGGPHGPYRQSERHEIYRDGAAQLLECGHGYESFWTTEEVEARRLAAGQDPELGYDNADRFLTDAKKQAFRDEGRTPVLRLRMPDSDLGWTDLVRGDISFAAGSVPDFVLVRGNGVPLYPFTNPTDDALMGVTDVLRGEDLLPSTPRQIALYQALTEIGVAQGTPRFGHLPLVFGEGNKKLSKRDPQSNFDVYRERGFLPEGLINYLSLLGWAIADDRDVFSVPELVEAFDITRVSANPARFDLKKAEAINATHLRQLPVEEFVER